MPRKKGEPVVKRNPEEVLTDKVNRAARALKSLRSCKVSDELAEKAGEFLHDTLTRVVTEMKVDSVEDFRL